MIFTELVLENFGAYANRNVIDLRPQNEEVMRPIVLLGGMNGGGKTTLMDAIRLALYGQRAKCSTRGNLGYGNFLIQSVNSKVEPGDLTKIELSFEHVVDDQWKEFKIIRAWNQQGNAGKDSLSIKVDNDYDNALAKTWDEYVENILPLAISNLFLFDGEQVKELAELDTPPQAVVEAISTLLGLELAEKLAIDLDVLVSRKRKSLADVQQRQTIEEIEARLHQLQQDKQDLSKELSVLQQQLIKAQKKQKSAYNKFRTEGGKIAAEKSELETKINHLYQQLEQYRNELIILSGKSLPLQLITPLLEQAKLQANQEIKKEQLQQAKDIIDDRDRKLINYIGNLALKPDHLDKIKFFLEQENQSINSIIQSQSDSYLRIDQPQLNQFNNIIDYQLPLEQQQAQSIITSLKQLETEISNLERQIAIAASPEAYQKLNDALVTAQKKLDKCEQEYQRSQYQYTQIDRKIESTKKELKNYGEQNINVAGGQHLISSAAKVQQTLNLFRTKLTLKKLNKLEVEVTECFRYLLHKSNLVHKVVIEQDSFRISLYDPQGKLLPKKRLSAGEKQLLAIAFLWGLARVSGRSLPIAIDTPLGRLDSSHRHNLVERYFPAASHQVILLSTDTEIGEKEIELLRKQDAIAREYLLKYNSDQRQTTVETGYFW
ncbi:MAG: DNA sulfur modification protein DndD [Cyanobacteria bacterium P01_A01_bin.83]